MMITAHAASDWPLKYTLQKSHSITGAPNGFWRPLTSAPPWESISTLLTSAGRELTPVSSCMISENEITVKDSMTLDEFAALCKEIYEKTGYKTYFNYESQLMEYMVRANDVTLFEKDVIGGNSGEDVADLFLLIERGFQEGWMIDYSLLGTVSSVEEHPIVYGTTPEMSFWCAFYNSNQCAALQCAAPEGMELALTTAPSKDVKKSAYLREAMSLVVPAKTQGQNQDAAVALLNWWINSNEANQIILGEPGVPANTEAATHITSLVDDTQARTFTYITDVVTPVSSTAKPPARQFFLPGR